MLPARPWQRRAGVPMHGSLLAVGALPSPLGGAMQGASKHWCGTLGTSPRMGGAFPSPCYGVLQCECP